MSSRDSSAAHGQKPNIPRAQQGRFIRMLRDLKQGDKVIIETKTHPQNQLKIVERRFDEHDNIEYVAKGPRGGRYIIMPHAHPEKRRDGYTGPQMFHVGTTDGTPYDRKAEGAITGLAVIAGTVAQNL